MSDDGSTSAGAYAELQAVIAEQSVELDDASAEFVSVLREAGVLSDQDWARILQELRSALRFLSGPNSTASKDANGCLVLDLDADPRNADWLRSIAASRLAEHHLPLWSSLWLWRIGHDRGDAFWRRIRIAASDFGCPPSSLPNE